MPQTNLTDITLVLDRSGSMGSIKLATIESFNGFLASQQTGAGVARMSLVQFDDQYEPLYAAIPAAQAPRLTNESFQPRGSTALLDAIGRTIVETGARLAAMPEHERPGTVLFVTLTDGQENASREYTLDKINWMIAHQRDVYAWQFVFLAANQDAIATAAQMGIDRSQALTFAGTTLGTNACVDALNVNLHKLRSARAAGQAAAQFEFEEQDRHAANPTT